MSHEKNKFSVLPEHIAIIMDGNGRWAKQRGLERTEGHKVGAEVFRKICQYASDIGIKYMTFYAFSTENWKRSAGEIGKIMDLLRAYLGEMQEREEENEAAGYNVQFIGSREGMPEDIVQLMDIVECRSQDKDKIHINIAVNYGGRDEIVHSVKQIAEKIKSGELEPSQITEDMISGGLYTAGQPDPDLIIRPSGEYRLSNFLIWQAAYAEFYYDNVLWPDFTPDDLDRAIRAYEKRNRRFGGV
ncbi:MAG: polyprenyl diphosphate synthase [Faecalibacterium sp.]|nr:polyprenyl diphosphate synthase [Ruminococcus sp.]MCM1392006.1 polyprenyl diphosphate synthase [Ruminococcus sp.]MCM1485734.1 polyprenyl diphosphate synthase [Faecalibacterium sp.]